MDFSGSYRLRKPAPGPTKSPLEEKTAQVVTELLNSAVAIHKLHLKVTGTGSYAAHKALNEFYDEIPDLADGIAESFQGAHEVILQYTEESSPKTLYSVEDALSYLRELYSMVTELQSIMPYSDIVNEMDNVKSLINSTKYKLKFLS